MHDVNRLTHDHKIVSREYRFMEIYKGFSKR